MLLSLLWTIDFKITFEALSKEIPLLLLPICFSIVPISSSQKNQIISNFSYGFTLFVFYCLLKAIIRFIITQNTEVFFYHQLVTLDVNAIHVSAYSVIAFFYFFTKKEKRTFDKLIMPILALFIILLSSKNIIVIFFILLIFKVLFSKNYLNKKQLYLFGLVFLIVSGFLFNKVKDRFLLEIESNAKDNSVNSTYENGALVYNVSINDAWNKDKFNHNDFFPGTALRVYQARVFFELLQEENITFTGYGLNASWAKLKEKRIQHNLYPGYENFNFHNQYIQNFAELGVVGFLLLVIMVILTLKNGSKSKDFIHISFAILMISLFLTESFLWRQRGVVFFTVMYCLVNSKIAPNKSIKNKKT